MPTRSLQAGHGDETIVFLHGTSGHLEAFIRNIKPHAERYTVHAIDMLGHGYTGKPDFPYEIPRYRDHLLAYFDAVGIEKAHIGGESLGGWVGGRTAIDNPERVISLQLLAAGGTVANPEVMERIRTSTRRAVESDDVELTRRRMHLLMHDPANATEELVAVRHAIYQQPDFVANIDNLLSLQDIETRACATSSRPSSWPRSRCPRWSCGDATTRSATCPEATRDAPEHRGLRAGAVRRLRPLAAARAGRRVQRAQPGLPREAPAQ